VTTVVYLHGVGGSAPAWNGRGWDLSLRSALAAVRPDLSGGFDTVAVDFDDLMDRPGLVRRQGASDFDYLDDQRGDAGRVITGSAEQNGQITAYRRRRDRLSEVVQDCSDAAAPPGVRWPCFLPGEMMVRVPLWDMRQAGHYRHDRSVQSHVLDRVSEQIEQIDDDVILLAHSLGSVVALDALHMRSVQIGMFISFGSPIGVDPTWGGRWEGSGTFPYDRVGSWLNVVNLHDFITWRRGLSRRFPEAVDAFIRAGVGFAGPGNFHDPATYLGSGPVVAAVAAYLDSDGGCG